MNDEVRNALFVGDLVELDGALEISPRSQGIGHVVLAVGSRGRVERLYRQRNGDPAGQMADVEFRLAASGGIVKPIIAIPLSRLVRVVGVQ